MSSGKCFGWTSVYNIVIPGQDNGDFVAPAASKTLASLLSIENILITTYIWVILCSYLYFD